MDEMHTEKEINEMAELFKRIWLKYPNQRFGQVVINYLCKDRNEAILFMQEDKMTKRNMLHELMQ